MLSASRCITNLQEALPRSQTILVEAVPVLLQKLKRIEYIDVAEQALVILEVISRRNAKSILSAAGVQAVISHVDFFSLATQRISFQIAANCAGFVTNSDFHLVQDSIADLTQRLNMDVSALWYLLLNTNCLYPQDKRCVESICLFFNRLIENVRYFPTRLRQLAGTHHELLRVFQQLASFHCCCCRHLTLTRRRLAALNAANEDQLGRVREPTQVAALHVHELWRPRCRPLRDGLQAHAAHSSARLREALGADCVRDGQSTVAAAA